MPSQFHVFLRLPPLTLKSLRWQPATLSCFNTRIGAQGPLSNPGCKEGRDCSRDKENLFLCAYGIIVSKFIARGRV